MAEIGASYMPLDRQLFRRTMAEALASLLRQKYRTAKLMARAVGIDHATAENLDKGHLSVTTLQKVLAAEGRALWNALGDELFGETFYQFEERRLAAAVREAESVRSNLVRLRAASEELLAGAGVVDAALSGPAAGQVGRATSDTRSSDHGSRRSQAQGQGDYAPATSVEHRSFDPKGRSR